jgi:branched-chain amino acid transport system substrate-binding protein
MKTTRIKRKSIGALAAIVAAVTLSACGSSSPGAGGSGGTASSGSLPNSVKVGVPIDLTGSAALGSIGVHQQQGVKQAVAEINDSGFLGKGVKLDPVYVDTQAAAATAVQDVTQMIQQQQVKAVIGMTLSGLAVPIAQVTQAAGVPTISGIPSVPGVTDVGDHIFRVLPDLNRLFAVSDPKFVQALGAHTVAFIYNSDNPTTAASYQARKAAMDKLGVQTVSAQTMTATDTDLRGQLTAIRNAHPDVVFVNVNAGQQPAVYNQGQQLGLFPVTPVVGDYSIGGSNDLQQAGGALQCAMYDSPWDPLSTSPKSADFLSGYKKLYGEDPDAFSALGYEQTYLIAQAFKNAGSTNATDVVKALKDLKDFKGVLGTYQFDDTRQPTYPGLLRQIVNGKPTEWSASSAACKRS